MQTTQSPSRQTTPGQNLPEHILSYEQIEFFDREGYLVIPPKTLRSNAEEADLLSTTKAIFPSYESGFSPRPDAEPKSTSPRVYTFDIGDISFVGLGREFMGNSPQHSAIRKGKENWLYGKRLSLPGFHRPKTLARFAECPGFMLAAKQLLRADELSLHTSGISTLFPGYLGEHGQFHTDTSGYTSDALSATRQGRFILVSLTYLVDVDLELAPMRVIPKSHKHYLKINEIIARSKGRDPNRNQMTQGGGALYQELLPDYLESPIKLTGPAGTTIFMHSGLLHSATENFSSNRSRTMLSVNYSVRQHQEFRKKYRHAPDLCRNYASAFKDPQLTYWTYVKFSGPPSLSERVHTKLGMLKSKIKSMPASKAKVPKLQESPLMADECHVSIDQESLDIRLHSSTGTKLISRTNDAGTLEPTSVKQLRLLNLFQSLGYQETISVIKKLTNLFPSLSQIEFHIADADKILSAYDQRDFCFFERLPKSTMPIDSWLRYALRAIMGAAVDLIDDNELYSAYQTKSRTEFLRAIVFRSATLDSVDSKQGDSSSFFRDVVSYMLSDAGILAEAHKCDETSNGQLLFKGTVNRESRSSKV